MEGIDFHSNFDVQQESTENTESLMNFESMNMNTPDMTETEFDNDFSNNVNNTNNNTLYNNSNDIRSVISSIKNDKVKEKKTSDEFINSSKIGDIINEMRKDMLEVVNVSKIATMKADENENKINRLINIIEALENKVNSSNKTINTLQNELETKKELISNLQTEKYSDDIDNNDENSENNEDTDDELSNSEEEESDTKKMTNIKDARETSKEKVFKTKIKRTLKEGKDVIGLSEPINTEKNTNLSRASIRKKKNNNDNDKKPEMSAKEYRKNIRRI